MNNADIYIPPEWIKLDLDREPGLLMVIGAPDTGKSTFASYLFQRLCSIHGKVAFLDGDPGQSRLGPPTCMTLALSQPNERVFPPRGRVWRKFVGSNSPSGHMLPVLVGAKRLIDQARQAGYTWVVYDTTGLIDPAQGGLALKYAKIDLLQPDVLIAFQKATELEVLLRGLRLSKQTRIVDMRSNQAIIERDSSTRQYHRQKAYRSYFEQARHVILDWQHVAILPAPRFALNRLVSLENRQGFSLGLGIVVEIDRIKRQLDVLTPLSDISAVSTVYLGDLMVSPETFKDQRFA